MSRRPTLMVAAALVLVNVVGAAEARAEQQPPPIHGVTGTVATEETVKDVDAAGRGILGKVARLFRWNRRSSVPSDAAGDETFAGLKAGTAVVVHNAKTGENITAEDIDRLEEGVQRKEGVITAVNPSDRTISIRLADGTQQTLRLSDPAGGGVRVLVVVMNEGGERVVHYFRRVP